MNFGITLANRGVLLGLTPLTKLLALAGAIEARPLPHTVWVGEALFVIQRLDALILLAAIAGRTGRVRLGPSCMCKLRATRCARVRLRMGIIGRDFGRTRDPVRAAARRRNGTRKPRRCASRSPNAASA
jgi:hypothetical protein